MKIFNFHIIKDREYRELVFANNTLVVDSQRFNDSVLWLNEFSRFLTPYWHYLCHPHEFGNNIEECRRKMRLAYAKMKEECPDEE